MELKLPPIGYSLPRCCSSNRTFMELKFQQEQIKEKATIGSNRTFMELK